VILSWMIPAANPFQGLFKTMCTKQYWAGRTSQDVWKTHQTLLKGWTLWQKFKKSSTKGSFEG
jgi:hypothetical protein